MSFWHPVMNIHHFHTLDAAAQAEAVATTLLPQLIITSPMLAASSCSSALPDTMLKEFPDFLHPEA